MNAWTVVWYETPNQTTPENNYLIASVFCCVVGSRCYVCVKQNFVGRSKVLLCGNNVLRVAETGYLWEERFVWWQRCCGLFFPFVFDFFILHLHTVIHNTYSCMNMKGMLAQDAVPISGLSSFSNQLLCAAGERKISGENPSSKYCLIRLEQTMRMDKSLRFSIFPRPSRQYSTMIELSSPPLAIHYTSFIFHVHKLHYTDKLHI